MVGNRPSVTAGPKNQYVAVGNNSFSIRLTHVDHMEIHLSYRSTTQHNKQSNRERYLDINWQRNFRNVL